MFKKKKNGQLPKQKPFASSLPLLLFLNSLLCVCVCTRGTCVLRVLCVLCKKWAIKKKKKKQLTTVTLGVESHHSLVNCGSSANRLLFNNNKKKRDQGSHERKGKTSFVVIVYFLNLACSLPALQFLAFAFLIRGKNNINLYTGIYIYIYVPVYIYIYMTCVQQMNKNREIHFRKNEIQFLFLF